MARRPGTHVPKFGNWDANDHMPFTVVFDHARQGRGKPINPNDPSENLSMFPGGRGNGGPGRRPYNPNDPEDSLDSPDVQQERQQEKQQDRAMQGTRESSTRGQQQQQVAAGAAARRQVAAVPAQGNGMPSRPPPSDPKRATRDNAFDRSLESPSTSFSNDQSQSPSHPSGYQPSQGRGSRLGAASPMWDNRRKSSVEEGQMFAPATPNRSRLRSGGNNCNKEENKGPSAALPKFGAWDAQDPGSGDGFTVIFNNARNEKKLGGPVNLPRTPDHSKSGDDLYDHPSHIGYQRRTGSRKNWFCWCEPDVKA